MSDTPTTEEVIAFIKKAYPEATNVNIHISIKDASVNVRYGEQVASTLTGASLTICN